MGRFERMRRLWERLVRRPQPRRWLIAPDTGRPSPFVDCTCDHAPDQHGWGMCRVDGCECDGGWEE